MLEPLPIMHKASGSISSTEKKCIYRFLGCVPGFLFNRFGGTLAFAFVASPHTLDYRISHEDGGKQPYETIPGRQSEVISSPSLYVVLRLELRTLSAPTLASLHFISRKAFLDLRTPGNPTSSYLTDQHT